MSPKEEIPGQELTWVSGLDKQRKKRFSSKVKTGCETCKKRRVKCDEGKPTCANCNRSGRRCEGYQSNNNGFYWYEHDGKGIKGKDGAVISRVNLKYGNQGDKALLDLFLNKTAVEIVKFSNPYFWYTLVPQASWSHEGIRQAVAAVSLACQETDHCDLNAVSRRTQSIYHYNAAIRSLTATDSQTASADVMLICCVMFWLFENLKNRPCIAMTHLKAAVNMLNERPRLPSHREDLISSYIEPLLQESMIFAATVLPTGGRRHHDAPATMAAYTAALAKLQPSDSPKDLHTCRYDFGRCQQGLVIAKQMQMSTSSPDPDMSLVRKLYADWRKALDQNAHRFPIEYVRMLQMHHESQMMAVDIVEADITLIPCRASPSWRPRLRWILDEARYFAKLKQAQAKDPDHQSTINISLITLLSITARQCSSRDADFAEEAIELLEEYQWFEGMWNSKIAGELVRLMRTIDAENQLCRSGDLEAVFERAAAIKDDPPSSVKRKMSYKVPAVVSTDPAVVVMSP